MHDISPTDGDRCIDWGRTSADYSAWRPDYPGEFYDRLAEAGVGLPEQRILDLATGVGFLARNFARRGARVVGIDCSEGQIAEARAAAGGEGLDIDFHVAFAESTGLPTGSFDVVTASQCFVYFDKAAVIPELKRLLAADGRLVTCHFCWLPREDALARASEELVLKYNPDWSAADWAGVIPATPAWAGTDFEIVELMVFDADVPFTRESWRGRIRACRGAGAALSADELSRFDDEHAELLDRIAPPQFTVRHRIDAHIMRPLAG